MLFSPKIPQASSQIIDVLISHKPEKSIKNDFLKFYFTLLLTKDKEKVFRNWFLSFFSIYSSPIKEWKGESVSMLFHFPTKLSPMPTSFQPGKSIKDGKGYYEWVFISRNSSKLLFFLVFIENCKWIFKINKSFITSFAQIFWVS